jgi:hypothetical protein
MLFKWKRTWLTTYALKASPFAAELEEIARPEAAVIARGYNSC